MLTVYIAPRSYESFDDTAIDTELIETLLFAEVQAAVSFGRP